MNKENQPRKSQILMWTGMETMEKAEEAGEQGESTSQVSDSDVGGMETVMEKAEEAGEQGESTSQVSDSDVGGMETMENAEEAGEQGESTLQAPDSDVRTIPPPPPSEVAELREVVKNMASKMDTFVESITEKAEEAGEQGESTSQVSDSDVGTMETMEKAEEAAEQEESQEESELETINRRMLLKKKDTEKEAPAPDQTIINQAEPNALVGPKPYKAIVIGKKQAALGLLIARSFKTLQLPAVTEIYEGEPKAFELVVEMTEKEAKEPGAGDVRVKQEVIGNKNGMHDIELSKSKDDARKGLTNRRTMSVPMITGDSLIANTKHEEDNRFTLGRRARRGSCQRFQKTLNHGGRIGGPVSTPRIVFFRAKKLKEASDAFKGLPFQVFIVGKPHDETSSSSRPFLMRIDGVRYNKQLDSIKDDMNYLVMALHHNDPPYIDVSFSEGATVCDSSCNCFTSSTFRQAAPVCSGHTAHLESYKDHTWRGPKTKPRFDMRTCTVPTVAAAKC